MTAPDYIIWKITETEDELMSQLEHPEYFAEKIANLKAGSRRKLEVLAVRRAIKELFYGTEQHIIYDADGKPSIGKGFISISHTDGYAAVITSEETPVGIDIERIGNRVERVVSHFLKTEETVVLQMAAEAVADKAASSLNLLYHLAWSAKESAYKVLGRDYYDLKNRTSIVAVDWEVRYILLQAEGKEKPLRISFDFTDDYVLTFIQLAQ